MLATLAARLKRATWALLLCGVACTTPAPLATAVAPAVVSQPPRALTKPQPAPEYMPTEPLEAIVAPCRLLRKRDRAARARGNLRSEQRRLRSGLEQGRANRRLDNVWVTDSDFVGTDRGLRIKSMRGRGGTIENVFYENVRHQDIRLMVVELTSFYATSTLKPKTDRPPTIRNIFVKNVSARGAKQAIDIVGLPEIPIQNVSFENVDIVADTGLRCVDCAHVSFKTTKLTSPTGVAFPTPNAP